MSAPQTNVPVQKRRHWAPLIGLWAVLAFGAIMALVIFSESVAEDAMEEGAWVRPLIVNAVA